MVYKDAFIVNPTVEIWVVVHPRQRGACFLHYGVKSKTESATTWQIRLDAIFSVSVVTPVRHLILLKNG